VTRGRAGRPGAAWPGEDIVGRGDDAANGVSPEVGDAAGDDDDVGGLPHDGGHPSPEGSARAGGEVAAAGDRLGLHLPAEGLAEKRGPLRPGALGALDAVGVAEHDEAGLRLAPLGPGGGRRRGVGVGRGLLLGGGRWRRGRLWWPGSEEVAAPHGHLHRRGDDEHRGPAHLSFHESDNTFSRPMPSVRGTEACGLAHVDRGKRSAEPRITARRAGTIQVMRAR
jgi:hypothetical protein